MYSLEIQHLRAEVGTLEGFIERLSEEDLIERIGLDHRLAEVKQALAEALARPQALPLPISFRGKPVDGQRSIDGQFAGKALMSFIEANRAITAESVRDDGLKSAGPIPNLGRDLRLVQTFPGSFGFELELPPPASEPNPAQTELAEVLGPSTAEPDLHAEAVKVLLRVVQAAADDDEAHLPDLLLEVGPRALATVRTFADLLRSHEALFAADFGEVRARLDRPERVGRLVDVLGKQKLEESTLTAPGTITGIFTIGRQFEARLDDGRVIRGKLAQGIEDASKFKSAWDGKHAHLELHEVKLKQRARHVLLGVVEASKTVAN